MVFELNVDWEEIKTSVQTCDLAPELNSTQEKATYTCAKQEGGVVLSSGNKSVSNACIFILNAR